MSLVKLWQKDRGLIPRTTESPMENASERDMCLGEQHRPPSTFSVCAGDLGVSGAKKAFALSTVKRHRSFGMVIAR
jgi:hypothetical protein